MPSPARSRRVRVTDVFFTRTQRSTRCGVKLSCGHFQTFSVDAFNRRGPWKVGQTRLCPKRHIIVETSAQALVRSLGRKAARR